MRIGLNLLHAMPETGGSWNYVARLVQSLGEHDRENSYIAFVTDKSIGIVPRQPNFETVRVGINPVSRPQRILYENTLLQIIAWKHHLDLMHWFANTIALANGVPGVVTVYDLMVFENPGNFSLTQRFYLRAMFPYTARRATLLLPMSQSTAQDLTRVLKVHAERLVVIPAIVGITFQPVEADKVTSFRRKHGLANYFWLYVAHFYPHKNHLRLLQGYSELKLKGSAPWPLVLRGDDHGAADAVKRLVIQLGLESDVIFLPYLDEGELPVLFSAATALVFPSLYEGGGIPVLEAMACGCPVIASDIAPIRELGEDAVERFDPLNVLSIISAMAEFQSDPEKRLACQRRGLERVQPHRADQVVKKMISAYQLAGRP